MISQMWFHKWFVEACHGALHNMDATMVSTIFFVIARIFDVIMMKAAKPDVN